MATFTVTTGSDAIADDAQISLREALAFAAINPGADRIEFAEGVEVVSIVPTGDVSGDTVFSGFAITDTDAVIIDGDRDGDGAADVEISGRNGTAHFVIGAQADVTLLALNLTEGRAIATSDPGAAAASANGAGGADVFGSILNQGTLRLERVSFSANLAQGGQGQDGGSGGTDGGDGGEGGAAATILNAGDLTTDRVGFAADNLATGGAGGEGGDANRSVADGDGGDGGDGGAASNGIVNFGVLTAETAFAAPIPATLSTGGAGGPGGAGAGAGQNGDAGDAGLTFPLLTNDGGEGGATSADALVFAGAGVGEIDEGGAISFSISKFAGLEGVIRVTYRITLSGDLTEDDFASDTLFRDRLVFRQSGNETQLVTIQTDDDDLAEADEVVRLEIAAVTTNNGTIAVAGQAAETVIDSNDGLTLTTADGDTDEFGVLTLTGGAGGDRITGALSVDRIDGLGGDDTLLGRAANDTLDGGAGDDRLVGGADNDSMRGGFDDDTLFGGAGADSLLGQGGADELRAGGGDDFAIGGGGRDLILGGGGEDIMRGGGGRDSLRGGGKADQIFGQGGADDLIGGGGNDRLSGDRGADFLNGGGGLDLLTGGGGADHFLISGSGQDQITDFTQDQDQIQFAGATAFAQLSLTQIADDVLITFGGLSALVVDQDLAAFSASDFVF